MTELVIHARDVDEPTMAQIRDIATHPAVDGLVAIMPDCHLGAGCVIGFTGRFKNAVIPNVVGVDIGCGVLLAPIEGVKQGDIDFGALDKFTRDSIPLGKTHHRDMGILNWFESRFPDRGARAKVLGGRADEEFYSTLLSRRPKRPAWSQFGTLGGGNHFIEINKDPKGSLFLAVHTGSRHFGFQVANYFQNMAWRYQSRIGIAASLPRGLEHLPLDKGGSEYMKWLRIAQEYARLNRFIIADRVISFFGLKLNEGTLIDSVHNYISEKDGIVRKGAISAHKGERLVIPLNMASGIVLGVGKGNPAYNYSAPHGAGRLFSRKEMTRRLKEGTITMESFRKSMEGVFSTSILRETIDESPMAYKRWEDIRDEVGEAVEILALLRPVYNLKAPE